MFNFLKRLFHKKPLIDQIIDVTGVDNIEIWNCIRPNGSYDIPSSSRKPKSWQDPNFQWINIGFGIYTPCLKDDELEAAVISIWVDKNMNIVRYERNRPFIEDHSRSGRKFEKRICELYDQLADYHKFISENNKLTQWVEMMFKLSPEIRYSMHLSYKGIASYNFEVLEPLYKQITSI